MLNKGTSVAANGFVLKAIKFLNAAKFVEVIKLFDVVVLFVGIYLDSSVGITGNNLKKLKTLAALTAATRRPSGWRA